MFVNDSGIFDDGNYLALNGQGYGPLGSAASYAPVHIDNAFVVNRNDPGFRRPFRDPKTGKPFVRIPGRIAIERGERKQIMENFPVSQVVNEWGISNEPLMTSNATSLPPLIWRQLDEAVLKEPRLRLRAYADLSEANPVGGFDAYASSTFETQVMTDPGEAVMSMDGGYLEDARQDSAKMGLYSVPLPMTCSGFSVSDRQLAISRKGGRDTAFDTAGAEWAGRRVSETVEKRTIGLGQSFTFGTRSVGVTSMIGTSTVWGYLDFPYGNATTAFTAGSSGSWTPATFVNELLVALETLAQDRFNGPFILYNSTDWDQYFDGDYYTGTLASGLTTPTRSLRDRIRQIEKIKDVRRLDFLEAADNPFTVILVQMTPDVARAINGRGITTVQWTTKGGMEINFLVYCIWVPQMRASFSGRSGIMVGR